MNINITDIIMLLAICLLLIVYFIKSLKEKNIIFSKDIKTVQSSPLINMPMINPLYKDFDGRKYDYKTLHDPLTPPYKRDDEYYPINMVYARGNRTQFKKIGLLIDKNALNDDKFKFLNLVGRKQYFGSTLYDYYAVSNTADQHDIKFDLPDLHKELYTNDTIFIKELNKTYTIQIDKNLEFYYDPYLV